MWKFWVNNKVDTQEEIFSYANIWKLHVLNRTLWIVFVASLLSAAIWFYRVRTFDLVFISTFLVALVTFVCLLPQLFWQFKAASLILALTGIGLVLLVVVGSHYAPLATMGTATLMASFFFGRRFAYILVYSDSIIIAFLALLVHLGYLTTRDLIPPGERPLTMWIQSGVVFLAMNLLLIKLAHEIVSSLEVSLDRLKRQHAISRNLTLYDSLTGLPNRKLFYDRLEHAILSSERTLEYGALYLIDVDNLKNINDTAGHTSGDFFLTVVAERLSAAIKEIDTVARLGGDDFAVIVENLSHTLSQAGREAERIGEKILKAINSPVSDPEDTTNIFQNTISIGLTLFYGRIHTAEELVKRADIALYQAKARGKNQLRNFDMVMQRKVEERIALETDLKKALRNNELCLLLQPQYDTKHQIIGAEVLIRWVHKTRDVVYPSEFIPIAEDTGEIIEIGKWIIHTTCSQLHEWSKHPETQNLTISINVSPREFREPGYVDMIDATVRNAKIKPELLKLELTESLMLGDLEDTISKMERLREIGIGFSLDDFGTGYSSLSYLKRLPFSQIKIDQSFVRDLTTDKNGLILIRTIIGMAQNLNLHVIAEGVETREQLSVLTEMGCQTYQGFYFSRPVSIPDFEKLLFLS
ncbi:MAG TPA: EAL domain-containing protein [Turneriella sp.]|nr:EAL domain-containing protein [Turneriella sp.]